MKNVCSIRRMLTNCFEQKTGIKKATRFTGLPCMVSYG